MESATYHRSVITRTTTFSIKDYQTGLNQDNDTDKNEEKAEEKYSDKATEPKTLWGLRTSSPTRTNLRERPGNLAETFRQEIIKYIYSLLFMDRKEARDMSIEDMNLSQDPASEGIQAGLSPFSGSLTRKTTVSVYEYREINFNTVGTVRCADGRTVDFNLKVSASKEFAAKYEHEVNWSALNYGDPLVINLDGDMADVSDVMVRFDLDNDGKAENIRNISSGSGFLALDKDDNGLIDNGGELFGAKSGNGFGDLSAFDEDGNGWIDEGDSIFNKLKILYLDSNGTQRTYTLAEKGVGALCLLNVASEYEMGEASGVMGEAGGVIRKTGLFLYENGNAGTLQQVDLQTDS